MKTAISNKKDAYRERCKNKSDKNMEKYKTMKNRAKKTVARAMKVAAEKEIDELSKTPNKIFKFVKFMKKEGRDVEGGRCMRDKDGRLGFCETDRKNIWKEHMEKIMNEENSWDQITDVDMVEGPIN